MDLSVLPGEVFWARPSPVVGREQSGRRRVVVVSNDLFHDAVTTLALVVPVTSAGRGWDNHVAITVPGSDTASGAEDLGFAMTEQVRVISRDRLDGRIGVVDDTSLAAIRGWIVDYLT